ncbi:class I SAM-dependent methyltransferase [Rhizobiaceae bacterium BDR2-2]|uniref:Class I SAM-dependent methyltransferase n=1 Tax=Ectorhizobium quercum TaxID=2965071 RepID=A0AAE3SU89_9HYPH|nr:class I SAM-dependent methyltransferase [Ectorhizobium quercum]MCX8996980.1 class I SAM-dependent methyltransferase [Ectorhizobium quercum]
MSSTHQRFDANAGGYARFRPDYPPSILDPLSRAIAAVPGAITLPVIDVGSGTGIFTRQLAASLPESVPVVGVEPSAAMRSEAGSAPDTDARISYVDGVAEKLPAGDASVRAVVAATAAHWFDRPAFYREAHRVLVPSGVLAIVEYVRDVANSPAAAAIEAFLRHHGGPKAYVRPDYPDELRNLAGFSGSRAVYKDVVLPLTMDGFTGLALSSSHARPVVETLGQAATEAALRDLAAPLMGQDGTIPYGYRFQLFLAVRGA